MLTKMKVIESRSLQTYMRGNRYEILKNNFLKRTHLTLQNKLSAIKIEYFFINTFCKMHLKSARYKIMLQT